MVDYNLISDNDLYDMCNEGDEGAWQYTYNFILTICEWKKWNFAEPGELAQEVTLYLLGEAIKKVKEKNKFRNFVKVVTINKIKDYFRKTSSLMIEPLEKSVKNKRGEEFVWEYPDPEPTPDHPLILLEEVAIIDEAIKKLPQPCGSVVREYLNFKMGIYKDYKELSRVLKMPVPTISSRVSRCLKKLLQFKEIKQLRVYR